MLKTTSGERLTAVLFYGVVLLLAYLVFRIFEPFLVPLGWAGVLVVVFYPWHARIERRWGGARAALLSTAGVMLILIVPALLVMALFVRQGFEAARNIQHGIAQGQYAWVNDAWESVRQRIQSGVPGVGGSVPTDLPTLARENAERAAGFLAGQLGAVARNTVLFVFHLFVTLFASFYLFRDADTVLAVVRGALPFQPEHSQQMLTEARDLIYASVTTSLIIACLHGLFGGTAFAVVGLGAPVFWGVVMAFLSLLPVVGSWPIWVPAAIWLAVSGHWARALVLVAICAGLAGTLDNILRPILIGGRSRLNGLLVFISVLGGISVFGMLGVVLGPIVVATTAGILDVYTRGQASASAG